MTMIEAGADAVGGAGDTVGNAGDKVGKKFGLTGSQKAGAISAGLPQPRTHHPYLLGLIFIVAGGFWLVGSITGTLPSMIAALFDPSVLDDSDSNPPSIVSDVVHDVVGISTFGLG